VQRFKVGAGLNYIVSENLNLISGGEFYHDNGEISDNAFGSHHLQLNNAAAYVQLFWKISHFNMVAGGRAEHNNTYGSAFVPRVAITRIINNFHFKLLASEAFRSPSVGNIDVSSNLKVEKTLVFETEIGYKLNNNMFITGNIFDISITNPITYYSNGGEIPLLDWYYKNAVKQGSDGVELEYRYKYAWGSSAISYSFYTDKWKSIPDLYKAEGHANAVLGLPQHKFTLLNTFRINNRANVSPSVVYSGSRYGYVQDDSWNTVIKKYDPSLMLNVNFSFDNFLTRGLTLDLGAFNILNQKSPLIQPYNGGDPPYPGREREFLARLVYSFRAGR
jgi:outer membrane receptor protein involved in Fe transport